MYEGTCEGRLSHRNGATVKAHQILSALHRSVIPKGPSFALAVFGARTGPEGSAPLVSGLANNPHRSFPCAVFGPSRWLLRPARRNLPILVVSCSARTSSRQRT